MARHLPICFINKEQTMANKPTRKCKLNLTEDLKYFGLNPNLWEIFQVNPSKNKYEIRHKTDRFTYFIGKLDSHKKNWDQLTLVSI